MKDWGKWKEKFIIFGLAGILLLIICIPVKPKESRKNLLNQQESPAVSKITDVTNNLTQQEMLREGENGGEEYAYCSYMEKELEALLANLEGAGKVKVMVTVKNGRETIIEKDCPESRSIVSENDSSGGMRNTDDVDSRETTVFFTTQDGRQMPYVRKTLQPEVEGVAVLAEGGGNRDVVRNISETIQVLFGIDANKIKIAKMKTK